MAVLKVFLHLSSASFLYLKVMALVKGRRNESAATLYVVSLLLAREQMGWFKHTHARTYGIGITLFIHSFYAAKSLLCLTAELPSTSPPEIQTS